MFTVPIYTKLKGISGAPRQKILALRMDSYIV